MRSELFDFLGSLHPLMVHLPIGIILLTIAIDVFMRNKNNSVQRVITMGWFFSFFSGLLAALFGWFLGDSGYYFEEQINIHRWSGVALVLLSFMIWILLFINFRFNKSFKQSINITAIILLMLTGHFGGEMTHGQNYLFDNLPFVKKEISLTPLSEVESSEVDSLYVFEDLIFPVLEEKCITCHNENRAYGGLNMNAFESMMEGGNSGSGIQKGKPYESLIYKRISFPQDHPKFMPPAGVPMSYDQIAIMEWWIDKGAKKQMPINLARNDAKMLRLMEVLYKFDLRKKTYLETLKLPGLSSEELNGLNDEKFIWRFLNAEKSFLDVKFTAKTIQKVDLLIMQKVKENVTWLNLADCMLSDELLSYLGTFRNLTRLKIQKNPLVTDKGIDGLKELKNLSELNLYGTSVTDAAFSTLGQMTALKKLFLWNTLVTPSGIKNFKTQNPEIEVIAGL